MLSETAKVLSVSDCSLKLQTSRQASCSGCSLKSGCGQYLLSRDRDQLILNPGIHESLGQAQLQAGDEVIIGLAEGQFLRLTFLFYLLPLLGLLLATLLADRAGFPEAIVALSALSGMAAGFTVSRMLLGSLRMQQATSPSVSRIPQNRESQV